MTSSSSSSLSVVIEPTDALMTQATECVEGECTIEDVSDLLVSLKKEQKKLSDRLNQMNEMIANLEVLNDPPKDMSERQVDEVRETVRAIFRIFQFGDKASGNDYPAMKKPMGYSGEVGDGPTTAYKALNPKKWVPKP
jgi:hypothetical protein